MATIKDINKSICDDVFTELEGIKERIEGLKDKLSKSYPAGNKLSELYGRHLRELSDQIEWRLQIVSHTCSYDWKGSADYGENTVSVGPAETFETDFSGGYIGG